MKVRFFQLTAALSLIAPDSLHAAVTAEFAKKLVELRAEVEEAGAGYEEAMQKRKIALDPVHAKQAELESQLAKEELRRNQLREKLRAVVGSGKTRGTAGRAEDWKELNSWADRLTVYIERSVPFRKKERLEKVKSLSERIRLKRESPITVGADLWSASEKELLLTKDVEYRVGRLPGIDVDVEIARLGMTHLLYLTSKGVAGHSRLKEGKWELSAVEGASEKAAIERVVARLKAKSSNGWYELPGLDSIPRGEME